MYPRHSGNSILRLCETSLQSCEYHHLCPDEFVSKNYLLCPIFHLFMWQFVTSCLPFLALLFLPSNHHPAAGLCSEYPIIYSTLTLPAFFFHAFATSGTPQTLLYLAKCLVLAYLLTLSVTSLLRSTHLIDRSLLISAACTVHVGRGI